MKQLCASVLISISFLGVACGDHAASPDAPGLDGAGTCRHVLYVNFEEQAVVKAPVDNAQTNTSSLAKADVTVPAYRPADPDRASKIGAITTQVQTTLAPFGVGVVVDRPATGPYAMVLMGGDSVAVYGFAGVGAIASSDCTTGLPQGVGFVFAGNLDPMGTMQAMIANQVVALYGILNRVPLSSTPGDCMCFADSTCTFANTACTIGGPATPRSTRGCGAGDTFDEAAAFHALVCP